MNESNEKEKVLTYFKNWFFRYPNHTVHTAVQGQ